MKKILLVEDDVFVRDIYSRELKKGDYEIVLAEDGQIGIDKATTEQFDLILLDIMLPKKTGIDVLRELRASSEPYKNTPVCFFTCCPSWEDSQRSYNRGEHSSSLQRYQRGKALAREK